MSSHGRGNAGTWDRILDTATDLFYRHGIRATGEDAVVAASGMSRQTFYNQFGSAERRLTARRASSGAQSDGGPAESLAPSR